MTSLNFWCNRAADLLDEGYEPDVVINKIQNMIKSKKLNIKIEKVLREFKFLYGHDIFYYNNSINKQIIDINNEELLNEFLKNNS